jgi:hypothetical protein
VPPGDANCAGVLSQLDRLCDCDGDALRAQPFRTPVRDTALALVARPTRGRGRRGATRPRGLFERDARSAALPRAVEATALVLTALARGGHV